MMNAISAVLGTKDLTSLISASIATETVSRKQAKSVDDARKAKESLDRTVEEANAAKSAAEAAKSELDGKIGEASAYRDSLSDDIRSQIESDTVASPHRLLFERRYVSEESRSDDNAGELGHRGAEKEDPHSRLVEGREDDICVGSERT